LYLSEQIYKFPQRHQNTHFKKVNYRERCANDDTFEIYSQHPDMRRSRRGIIRSHRFLSRCRENEKLKGWVNDMRSCRVVSTGTISQFYPQPLSRSTSAS